MRNLFGILIALCLLVSPAYAGKFTVDSTSNGQYTDVKVTGANSATTKVAGDEATIDLSSLAQVDTSATTTEVLALSQAATVGPVLAVTCTSGGGVGADNTNTCGSYTSTDAAKAGSIKIYVNGVARYVDFKVSPN